ncbi:hypothetical protein AE42_01846 [Enterobacter kobei]|nr:hypothetical protein AE42_01846 [Enterobacter kobei]
MAFELLSVLHIVLSITFATWPSTASPQLFHPPRLLLHNMHRFNTRLLALRIA